MKQIKYIILAMFTLGVLASAVVVSAQGGPPPQGPPPQGTPQGQPPQGQPGQGQPPQGQPGSGDWAGVVQIVSSTSLTVLRANNETFTAVISSTTKVDLTVSQSAGTVSDIQVGNNVMIEGRPTSATSVAASRIMVEPSGTKVIGSVTAVSGATISITSQKDTWTVTTTSDTKFHKGTSAGSLSDVTTGAFVVVYGTKQSDSSVTATDVFVGNGPGLPGAGLSPQSLPTRSGTPPAIPTCSQTPQPPPAQGQPPQGQPQQGPPAQGDWIGVVQTMSSASLTILRSNNQTFTATISSTTKIELVIGQTAGTVSDIQVGNNVTIEGRRVSASSVAANRILVEPNGSKVSGVVTAISDATISMTSQKATITVLTTSDTQFFKGTDAASLSDVTAGAFVTAYGTKQTDGSITATYVLVNAAPGSQPPSITAQSSQEAQPTPTPGEVSASNQKPELQQNLLGRFVQWLLGLFNSQ